MTAPAPFRLALAGHVVEIHPRFPAIRAYCDDYLTDAPSDMTVAVTPKDIADERERARREAELEGIPVYPYTDAYLETLAVYRQIAVGFLDFDTILFHGSCISVDGEGYLFTAPSGTGKSTHTRLWQQHFGDRFVMVNDDKPLLQITHDSVIAYGTPWNGKHRLSTPIGVPLRAICFLSRAQTNSITPISAMECYPTLLQQTYRPPAEVAMIKTLELLSRLIERVRFYDLKCNMDPEAAIVAYRGIQ